MRTCETPISGSPCFWKEGAVLYSEEEIATINERILVVDDDPSFLCLMQDLLGEEGYHVRTSTRCTSLLHHVQRSQPDLILLDVFLGEEDGRILCRQLKANALTKHIPVILVSAYTTWHEALVESCADDFLAKPFTGEELLEAVEKHLSDPRPS